MIIKIFNFDIFFNYFFPLIYTVYFFLATPTVLPLLPVVFVCCPRTLRLKHKKIILHKNKQIFVRLCENTSGLLRHLHENYITIFFLYRYIGKYVQAQNFGLVSRFHTLNIYTCTGSLKWQKHFCGHLKHQGAIFSSKKSHCPHFQCPYFKNICKKSVYRQDKKVKTCLHIVCREKCYSQQFF